jgi:hypothetical protein
MADAMYIGSIVVENISLKPKGDPSIEMTISSTREGSISADAVDLGNPANEHHLSVSLKSFEDDKNEYPDFEMDETQKPESLQHPRDERKFPWLPIIILGIVLILICLGLWYFLFRGRNSSGPKAETTVSAPAEPAAQVAAPAAAAPPAQPEAAASKPVPTEPAQPARAEPARTAQPARTEPAKPPVVVERPPRANPQPVNRNRTAAPVYSFNVPQTIPPEGIVYTVRWGDTLWDISEAFYRNPRLYTVIVRSNEISNPNLIVSGTELTILPRN